MNIISPCIGVCQLDGQDMCIGCLRSKAEIGAWSYYDETEKLAVLNILKQRRRAMGRTSAHDSKQRRRKSTSRDTPAS